MGEAQQQQGGATEGAAGAQGAGAEGSPPAGEQPAKKPEVAAGGGGGAAGTQTAAEAPTDAEIVKLSPAALKQRLDRHTSAELKRLYGTDDAEQIQRDKKELAELREDREKKRKAALDKEQLLAEERDKANARAEAAETKARQIAADREYERSDSRISKLAEKHIDPEFVDAEMTRFARHLTDTYSKRELDKMRTKDFEAEAAKFFEERVKAKPKLARDYEDKRREELRKELKDELSGKKAKVPVTNGSGKETPAQGRSGGGEDGGSGGKTMKPGGPNSMTSGEARAAAAKSGHRWW